MYMQFKCLGTAERNELKIKPLPIIINNYKQEHSHRVQTKLSNNIHKTTAFPHTATAHIIHSKYKKSPQQNRGWAESPQINARGRVYWK